MNGRHAQIVTTEESVHKKKVAQESKGGEHGGRDVSCTRISHATVEQVLLLVQAAKAVLKFFAICFED